MCTAGVLGLHSKSEEYSVWISLSSACSGPSGSSSLFSGAFIAEEVGGVGDKRSGDTTTVDRRHF
jgi:hypothetical protein